MRHYVYNSGLRDAAAAALTVFGARLRALSIGGDPRQDALFRSGADVRAAADLAAGGEDLAQADVVLCRFGDAVAMAGAPPTDPLFIVVAGRAGAFELEWLRALAALESAGFAIAAQQSAACDYGAATEHVFVLERSKVVNTPIDALKRAIVFDAHALQSQAAAHLARYNTLVSLERRIDATVTDCTHEVESFSAGGVTRQLARPPSEEEGAYTATREIVFDPARLSGRALSIHVDGAALPDWKPQLLQLAQQLAVVDHVEVLMAPPLSASPEDIKASLAALESAGVSARIVASPTQRGVAWRDSFLAHTAPEAVAVAYMGGPRVPATSGWDWDVLRAAQNVGGDVFTLKTSPNKGRYVTTADDALRAAEGFPIVSRAWIECCGGWSFGKLAPHEFQALVAYYFDAVDWMNKHRKLRLGVVATVRTAPVEGGVQQAGAFNATPRARSPFARRERQHAKRLALQLHARDWTAGEDAPEPALAFRSSLRRLHLTATAADGRSARWFLSHGAFRPPV